MAHRVTLIPGDGTGPELVEATRRVLEATGVEFDWDVQPAGEEVMHEHGGNPLPPTTLESIRQNKVNPMAELLSGMLMLRHLGEQDAARRLERAIADVIADGERVTYDMKPTRDDPTAVGTSEVADAIIDKLNS